MGESEDFFQAAWDRHISHLREATRASVIASIVDFGGGGTNSGTGPGIAGNAGRPNSRATSPPVTRQSMVDGTSFHESPGDSFRDCSRPGSARKESDSGSGNNGPPRIDFSSSAVTSSARTSKRFSFVGKLRGGEKQQLSQEKGTTAITAATTHDGVV